MVHQMLVAALLGASLVQGLHPILSGAGDRATRGLISHLLHHEGVDAVRNVICVAVRETEFISLLSSILFTFLAKFIVISNKDLLLIFLRFFFGILFDPPLANIKQKILGIFFQLN